ncbi:hypothetical protein FRE64_00815 [Euhalothece natronophila Z-M001]|uniref:Uncharacterized protein n=1 Tax=Euhalothece natronophila Z-M001 TaxID=522448 RepID=A0A5B8NKI0_9CHRO|nr:hypothetical protein [Euhalothece natronophila]QDZ38609.1 hypothetical protein FRE64_00815 [Euhalothece natronophila Z-M001]
MLRVSPSLFQSLEQQQQLIMMKKLLFAVCRNYWENNRTILASTKLEDLLLELYECYPSRLAVRNKLEEVVEGLNKREKYYPISAILIQKISKIYDGSTNQDQTLLAPLPTEEIRMITSTGVNVAIPNIVHKFEQDEHYQRIHKILFALYAKCWENDPNILYNYPLDYLIKEVYRHYSNLESLTFNLLKIIKGLNKQGIYSQVAQKIINELANLYQEEADTEPLTSLASTSKITLKNQDSRNYTKPIKKYDFNNNIYQIRKRLMKSTNPLRAKIILYYLLYSSQIETQEIDQLFLKSYELDQMLLQVPQKIKTLENLQVSLEETARKLSANHNILLNNLQDNLNVTNAIILSLKPLYETY